MADGYGFGGEGDWKTSALLRTIKVMGAGLPGGTSFMEDYTYHLGPGTPRVLGAHMLEVCPSIASARPRCEIHPLSIGGREDPVRLVFDAVPGEAVVVGLSDLGDRFRLTANAVDVISPSEPLHRLPVARAVWKPRPSLAESAESWLLAGAPHHTVLSSAVDIETLTDYAAMSGVELLTIDENTSIEQFAKEVRWNAAYHRLAQALWQRCSPRTGSVSKETTTDDRTSPRRPAPRGAARQPGHPSGRPGDADLGQCERRRP
jgi:L-arabinose isomerase